MPLVDYMIRGVKYPGFVEFDDLRQAGYLGLLNAVKLFDADRGYAFSTYACKAIRRHIIGHLKKEIRDVWKVKGVIYDDYKWWGGKYPRYRAMHSLHAEAWDRLEPWEQMYLDEEWAIVRDAVGRLLWRHRLAVLSWADGLRVTAIGEGMGASGQTGVNTVNKAVDFLRGLCIWGGEFRWPKERVHEYLGKRNDSPLFYESRKGNQDRFATRSK